MQIPVATFCHSTARHRSFRQSEAESENFAQVSRVLRLAVRMNSLLSFVECTAKKHRCWTCWDVVDLSWVDSGTELRSKIAAYSCVFELVAGKEIIHVDVTMLEAPPV